GTTFSLLEDSLILFSLIFFSERALKISVLLTYIGWTLSILIISSIPTSISKPSSVSILTMLFLTDKTFPFNESSIVSTISPGLKFIIINLYHLLQVFSLPIPQIFYTIRTLSKLIQKYSNRGKYYSLNLFLKTLK